MPGWISNVDLFWDEPIVARFFEALGNIGRVILFDKRGTGLSDPIQGVATLEERMDDVRAVMDAAGSERATLFGFSEGGTMSCLFAATYPDRTRGLVLCGSYACRRAPPEGGPGLSEEEAEAMLRRIRETWGTSKDMELRMPSLVGNARFSAWWGRYLRGSASPSTAVALQRMNLGIDVRPILPSIEVPTLVLHANRDPIVDFAYGQYLAENIPGAHFVALGGIDHVPYGDCSEQVIDQFQTFLTGEHTAPAIERVLGTIMFTDIVGSTALARRFGDREWGDMLSAHGAAIAHELEIYRGRAVKNLGDGVLAMFDGPARAIACARAIHRAVAELDLQIRIGIHTGECLVGEEDVAGIAVHIAARIGDLAGAGQVLVSQTVRDLVAGSGIVFQDHGVHALKGVDGSWTLCEVAGE